MSFLFVAIDGPIDALGIDASQDCNEMVFECLYCLFWSIVLVHMGWYFFVHCPCLIDVLEKSSKPSLSKMCFLGMMFSALSLSISFL